MESSSIKFYDTRPDPIPPPPGEEANFNGPNTNGHIFIAVAIIGILLATISSIMRVYTKAVLTRSFGIDDVMCIFTLIGAVIWTGFNIKLVELGMGLRFWNDNRTYGQRQTYSKIGLAANTSYFITICLVKVTILMLYLRTFTESKRFRYIVYATLAILVLSHLAVIPVYYGSVFPMFCHWTYYLTDEEWYENCNENYNVLPFIVFISCLTILLDIIILLLPCPAVWRLHLAKRQKVAIISILAAGILVTIASILRLAFMINRFYFDGFADNDLFTEYQVNTISTVEIDVAIICACLPTLKAFLKRFAPRLLGFSSSSSSSPESNRKPSAYSSFHYNKNTGGANGNGTGTGIGVGIGTRGRGGLDRNNKWRDESHEECLTMNAGGAGGGGGGGRYDSGFLEDEMDGKSRESYAMGEIGVVTATTG